MCIYVLGITLPFMILIKMAGYVTEDSNAPISLHEKTVYKVLLVLCLHFYFVNAVNN